MTGTGHEPNQQNIGVVIRRSSRSPKGGPAAPRSLSRVYPIGGPNECMQGADTDREFGASFDRSVSATNSVCFFVSFHRGATQSGILFLVSFGRGTSRRVYHRRPWLSDMSQLRDAPCRSLARPSCSARRWDLRHGLMPVTPCPGGPTQRPAPASTDAAGAIRTPRRRRPRSGR
jgi:hypothetical protein